MDINEQICNNCLICIEYCPVGAIVNEDDRIKINQDLCVECSVCLKSGICKTSAFIRKDLTWPRILRAQFSDPLIHHPSTDIRGRGTTEVKTNDVSGRFTADKTGLIIEVGRPGVSASFLDIEKIAKKLSGNVEFVFSNPVSELLNLDTGELKDDKVRSERVLSAIIECQVNTHEILEALNMLKKVAEEVDTVFSVGVVCLFSGYDVPVRKKIVDSGYQIRGNSKINVGLGRPLA